MKLTVYLLFFHQTYLNESSNDSVCTYHEGVPIFHEGLKYWTCCTRRTSDFQAFLNQEGCSTGTHAWKTEKVTFYNQIRLFSNF